MLLWMRDAADLWLYAFSARINIIKCVLHIELVSIRSAQQNKWWILLSSARVQDEVFCHAKCDSSSIELVTWVLNTIFISPTMFLHVPCVCVFKWIKKLLHFEFIEANLIINNDFIQFIALYTRTYASHLFIPICWCYFFYVIECVCNLHIQLMLILY